MIGELGAAVRLPSQTIRFYERIGLLPEPSRAPNGYRSYNESVISRVRFIRTAQAAGLTLAEIRGIIALRDEGQVPCAHVAELIDARLADVRGRISELSVLAAELDQLRDRGRRLDPADCSDADICHIFAASAQPGPD